MAFKNARLRTTACIPVNVEEVGVGRVGTSSQCSENLGILGPHMAEHPIEKNPQPTLLAFRKK